MVNPFTQKVPEILGGQPNITGAGDNMLGRIANTFAIAKPEGQRLAQSMNLARADAQSKQQAKVAASQALIDLNGAKTAEEANMIIGQAIADGADPSFFGQFIGATLDPTEILKDGEIKIGNRFGAVKQGANPAPKKPLVEINQGERETEFEKEFGKGQAKRLNTIIDDVDADVAEAERAEIALAEIEGALGTAGTTGVLDPLRIFAGNLAAQTGLVDEYDLTETASLERISAAANDLVIKRAKQLGTNPTDRDAKRLDSIVANIGKSNIANEALIDIGRQLNERSFARAEIVQNALRDGNEKDIPKLLREFGKNNPLDVPEIPTAPPVSNNGVPKKDQLEVGKDYFIGGAVWKWDGNQFIQGD